ncbi:RidA family protein [Gilvibacter sediminis]|uniref:RidA family protein n=1 Tax=Gilvibacter sediminis TaxID=379071 RepID=UPI00234FFAC2|nr:Rid family detoxifying hydrolase [Gilvibacter sediminis]MDC7997680.1 Rid family detoxifying hydrolase [Gilvibacter sediminis]
MTSEENPTPDAPSTPETAVSNTPEYHASHLASRQNTPFSDAVQVGNTFYLSGQIGRDHAKGKLVEGGIEAETRQTLENIKAVLNHHGMDMSNVVKALVVLDDIEDFAAFNAIYTSYLPQKPARTTFAAEALAAGAKIEIEVVAVKSE